MNIMMISTEKDSAAEDLYTESNLKYVVRLYKN